MAHSAQKVVAHDTGRLSTRVRGIRGSRRHSDGGIHSEKISMAEDRPPYSAGVPAKAQQTPSIGRIVCFVTEELTRRPAIITQIWDADAGAVGLTVFYAKDNPAAYDPFVTFDEAGDKPGTWHWPEYVAPLLLEAVG
jgi:hypothetical protein